MYNFFFMKKIGFFILSSSQELFRTNTELLKAHYSKLIDYFKYDIEVYSFVGDENCTNTYEKDNIIYCKSNDRDLSMKFYELFDYIVKNKDYEYIMITNNSNIINLELLMRNINEFLTNGFYYTNDILNLLFAYPNGNFKFFSKNILNILYNEYKEALAKIEPIYLYVHSVVEYGENMWHGIPEDVIIGTIVHKYAPYLDDDDETIKKRIIAVEMKDYFSLLGSDYCGIPATPNSIYWDGTLVANFKLDADYHTRLKYEPKLLKNIIEQIEHKLF